MWETIDRLFVSFNLNLPFKFFLSKSIYSYYNIAIGFADEALK